MNIAIYNSIIHGSLSPQSGQTPVDYSEVSHLLDNCPNSLLEIESLLNRILGKNLQVNFNADNTVNIAQFLNNQDYTPVLLDYFPPKITLSIPVPHTPVQRFYYFIITTESQRIKLSLLQSVEILKDDICAKEEIKGVLKLLARYAKAIREQTQSNPIFDFLLTQIVKLYFEITLMFDVLLSDTDYISFPDFYSLRLNRQADDTSIYAYNKALHIHQAQRLFASFDTANAQNLLSQLYYDLEITPTDNTLIAVICAIENAVFMQTKNTAIPAFAEIVDSNFAKIALRNEKQMLNNRLNTISNPREALSEIDNIAENIPDFPTTTLPITNLLTLSIARLLRNWLTEQREIYKNQITITNMVDKNAINQNIYAGVVATGDNAVVNTNDSTIVGGQNNTVSLSNDLRKEIEDLISQITAIANVLSDEQEEIIAELQRINVQLNKNQPKRATIASAFQTIYNVLCGVTGNLATPFVLDKIQIIVKALGL